MFKKKIRFTLIIQIPHQEKFNQINLTALIVGKVNLNVVYE